MVQAWYWMSFYNCVAIAKFFFPCLSRTFQATGAAPGQAQGLLLRLRIVWFHLTFCAAAVAVIVWSVLHVEVADCGKVRGPKQEPPCSLAPHLEVLLCGMRSSHCARPFGRCPLLGSPCGCCLHSVATVPSLWLLSPHVPRRVRATRAPACPPPTQLPPRHPGEPIAMPALGALLLLVCKKKKSPCTAAVLLLLSAGLQLPSLGLAG